MEQTGMRLFSGSELAKAAPSISLILLGCGHAAVTYNTTLTSTPDNASQIVDAASAGYVSIVLPITRVIVQPPGTTTLNPQPSGGAGGHPSPSSSNNSPNNSTPASIISTNVIGTDSKNYAVSFVQVEGDLAFKVKPLNNIFSSNQLGITFATNSRIPISVSNTFTDETAATIKSVASLVTSAITIAGGVVALGPPVHPAATPKCVAAPISIDITPSTGTPWTGAAGCYQVTIADQRATPGANQSDNVLASYFRDAIISKGSGSSSTVWPVPACMYAKLTIYDVSTKTTVVQNADIEVIDPDYVEPMPVPQKGKIAMHPICGADLSDNPANRWQTAFDVMTAIENAFPKPPAKSTGNGANAAAK